MSPGADGMPTLDELSGPREQVTHPSIMSSKAGPQTLHCYSEDDESNYFDPTWRMIHGFNRVDITVVDLDGKKHSFPKKVKEPDPVLRNPIRHEKEQVNNKQTKKAAGRKCSVCASPDLERIHEARIWGWSLRQIEKNYGIGYGSLARHFRNCETGKKIPKAKRS